MELPIAAAKDEILSLVRSSWFVVIVGDTGSGKTTQLPAYLLEAGSDELCPVAITQPRRVAATSVASRVAHNLGTRVGSAEVGYKVRFDSRVAPGGSALTFMTDGVLVRECVSDPRLQRYRTIMLDEVHERSVETDVLLGLVKSAVLVRKGSLRCVVSSATLNAEQFQKYFNQCPILRVPGRAYPVDVYHSKRRQTMTKFGPASRDYVEAGVEVCQKIHATQPPGHILLFLTGQDEIERACQSLRASEDDPHLLVLPLYGALPKEDAERIFDEEVDRRKIVVATNIAETSITVPGIRYVVDSGYVKLKGFEPSRSVASLTVVPVSKVAAEQRAGRAGRTGEGQCYRLYSKAAFEQMQPETPPEIKRSSMASVALVLKSLDVEDVLSFDFLDPPDPDQLACALLELHALGALDRGPKLTTTGRQMARLALEPNLAKCLIEAGRDASSSSREGALTACALLSAEDVWLTPSRAKQDDELRIASIHLKLKDERGDLFSLIKVFDAFERQHRDARPAWCRRHYLRFRALHFAAKARAQLDSELGALRLVTKETKPGGNLVEALCAGLCLNGAVRGNQPDAYVLLPSPAIAQVQAANPDNDAGQVSLVRIPESTSIAFTRSPKCICFHELRIGHNSRGSTAHNVLVIDDPELLRACRARLGTADLDLLNGRRRREDDSRRETSREALSSSSSDENKLRSKGNELSHTSPSGGDGDDKALVASARDRFLARKKARLTLTKKK